MSDTATILLDIQGEWWQFAGIESSLWALEFDEDDGSPLIHECTGHLVHGKKLTQVTFA